MVKHLLIGLFILTQSLATQARENRELEGPYYWYQVEASEGLGSILGRLNYEPLWEAGGWVEKIAQLNKLFYHKERRIWLIKDQWIKLPIETIPKSARGLYKVKTNDVLVFNNSKKLTINKPLGARQDLSLEFNISCHWKKSDENGKSNCDTRINSNLNKEELGELNFYSQALGHKVEFTLNGRKKSADKKHTIKALRNLASKRGHRVILVKGRGYILPMWEPSVISSESSQGRSLQSISLIKKRRSNYFFPQVGLVSHTFTQGNVRYESKDLNGIINYRHIFKSRWHVDLDFNMTLTSLSQKENQISTRFFELNSRLGYSLPILVEPWRFTIFAGIFAGTMVVAGDQFGYQPLVFPQLYPELRRVFSRGDIITWYGKWVPTQGDVGEWLGGSQRALSLGMKWINSDSFGYPISLSFEFSSLRYKPKNSNDLIDSEALTLGLGSSF